MLKFTLILASCAGMSASALAQEADVSRPWTATLSVSGSQTDADAADTFRSVSASLEREFEGFRLGASIGTSGGEILAPELLSVTDTSSLDGAAW